jgi:hypothetical protein
VQRQTVNLWLKCYRAQGEAGVLDGRRISPRALTADSTTRLYGLPAGTDPPLRSRQTGISVYWLTLEGCNGMAYV